MEDKIKKCDSSIEWEKFRYYQCVQNHWGNFNCEKLYYQDDYIPNSQLLFVNQKYPEFIDKYLLKYYLIPRVEIKKRLKI